MGTIAARDALRVLQLLEQVLVATLMTGRQAVILRAGIESRELVYGEVVQHTLDWVSASFDFLAEDRPLEADLRHLLARLQDGQLLSIYQGLQQELAG